MIAQAERTLWRRSDRRLQENIGQLPPLCRYPFTSGEDRVRYIPSSKREEVANGHRGPQPGTGYEADCQIQEEEYKAEVIAGEDGKVKYRLADEREFKSPSSAGAAITNKACNGWAFWSVEARRRPQRSGGARGRRIGRNGDWGANAHRWVPGECQIKRASRKEK